MKFHINQFYIELPLKSDKFEQKKNTTSLCEQGEGTFRLPQSLVQHSVLNETKTYLGAEVSSDERTNC